MVMRLDGVVACAIDLEQQHSFASSDWFVSTLRNETFTVTGDVALPASEQPTLVASLPLHTGEGKVVGVVALTLRPAWLRDVLRPENGQQIGTASCRARVCQYVSISAVAVPVYTTHIK